MNTAATESLHLNDTVKTEPVGRVAELEALSLRLWPPAEIVDVGGWRLGFSQGATGRANSVHPLGWDSGVDLDAAIEGVEAAYRARGLPPRFKLTAASRPGGLDARLAERGYRLAGRTVVMVADAAVLARPDAAVTWTDMPAPAWAETAWGDRPAELPIRVGIASAIPTPRAFGMLRGEHGPAGAALCGIVGGWGLICAVRTLPDHRRQGVAARIVGALAAWAAEAGAERLFLQVDETNAPARALYAKMGLTDLYSYWTRLLDS